MTSVIFWGVATPFRSLTYTDSLFFTVSAMSLAGLNTVNLSQLNTVQQVMLFILIMLGSAVGSGDGRLSGALADAGESRF